MGGGESAFGGGYNFDPLGLSVTWFLCPPPSNGRGSELSLSLKL